MSLERQLAAYGQHLRRAIAEMEVSMEPGFTVRPVPEEPPTHRRRWPIAAAGLAAVVAVVLAVLFWPRSGDPAPFIDQGSTIPDTTVSAPTTPAATGTTMAASEVRWNAPFPTPYIGGLVALSADDAWVLAGDGQVFRLNDGATFRLPQPEPGRQLAVAPDGTLWMTTRVGVFSFDGEAWTERLVGETSALTVDGDGAVWVGGIYWDYLAPLSTRPWLARWDGHAFVRIGWDPRAERQGGATVMAATPDGSIWVAEIGWLWSHLYRWAAGASEAVQIGDYPTNPSKLMGPVGVYDLEVAPNGDLWVGGFEGDDAHPGEDEGDVVLARYDGEQWTTYDWPFLRRSPTGTLWFDLAVSPDGTLWVSFPGGLGSYDGTTWSLRAATETGATTPGSVDVAPDGTVWYADEEGLHTLTP